MDHRAKPSDRSGPGRGIVLVAAVLAAGVAVGCQTFQPAEPSGLRPGQTVRVQLADSAARAEAGWTGPERESLTGDLVRSDPTGLDLSVRTSASGARISPYRDTLEVPASLIRSVERQRLSPLRSAGVAAGLVATAALLFELDIPGGGTAPSRDGGGPAESVGVSIPVFP